MQLSFVQSTWYKTSPSPVSSHPLVTCELAAMAKRHSPDSVICIDLTEDDDERQEKLQEVRKRLKGTPTPASTAARVKEEGQVQASTIDLVDDDGGGKIGSCAALQQQAVKQEQEGTQWSSEVEIVEPVAPTIHPVASAQAASTADHDIVVVGTANESRLPHMRQHCQEHKFVPPLSLFRSSRENTVFCDLCFCYVCDEPARECTRWHAHHNATDIGHMSPYWTALRKEAKQAKTRLATQATLSTRVFGDGPFEPGHPNASKDPDLTECRMCGWYNRFSHRNFAKLRNQNTVNSRLYIPELHPTGCSDWCHSCGRVASQNDFGKLQSKPYIPNTNDVFLGQKIIPFRLIAHDPRKLKEFQEKWATHEGSDPKWTFSKAEMEHDLFEHRFGKYPLLEMIIASIPVVTEDNIPKTVLADENETWRVHRSTDLWERRSSCSRYNYDSDAYDGDSDYDDSYDSYMSDSYSYDSDGYRTEERTCVKVSNDETEALILEQPRDRLLLEELLNFDSIGSKKPEGFASLQGDIVANWNNNTRSGVSPYFLMVIILVSTSLILRPTTRHSRSASTLRRGLINAVPNIQVVSRDS